MKKITLLLLPTLLLGACTWVTYDDNGTTRLRQKYPTGTSVYYEDGTYQQDRRYHEYRPKQHAIEP
ncbi:MAG: spore cortex protein [Neisseria sp.]|nr:spore cortex protein [Neisseria sp.]